MKELSVKQALEHAKVHAVPGGAQAVLAAEVRRLRDELEGAHSRASQLVTGAVKSVSDAERDRLSERVAFLEGFSDKQVTLYEELRKILDCGCESSTHEDAVENLKSLVDRVEAAEAALKEAQEQEPVAWIKGVPPHPYDKEWFIAMTIYGDRVVLKALPEEYTYDFTTADATYMKSANIKKWMQFPDSEYIPYASPVPANLVGSHNIARGFNSPEFGGIKTAPAVAVPDAPTDEQIHAAYREALGQSIRERDMPEIRKFAHALLQSTGEKK